ncbi:MAG: methyltransferase domain-containing protein, partial [Thermoanaerobaculia bacterium]
MSLEATLRSQFHNPHGLLGRVAGAIMASRPSNRQRNAWAVSLLDIQPHDRVLEIGFGPGLAIADIARRLTTGTAVGLDHSELMLLAASRRNTAAIAAGRVELRLGSAESLPA